MSRIFEVTDQVRLYHPKADIDLINRAYVFAAQAHASQTRSSGKPYLTHPLAVAGILASLKLDVASIVAGLLHDTVEDTTVTLGDIQARFGDEVAQLVDGVTKVGKIHFPSLEHKQAGNFRKMIIATAKDLRVLLVKLADRLHNMRTLNFLPEKKRHYIAQETMQLYAPLAHRLGIHWIKQELEDLAFSHLESTAYQTLTERMGQHMDTLSETREQLERILQEVLRHKGIQARVQGRMKHLYGLHEKMQRKHLDFGEIYDLVAFRIIVEDISTCYQTLGIIHSLYRPVPGRFKDYIALPKPNGYQSLHTSIIGPKHYRIEVQLRTEAMHHYAENGVAAHWLYKHQGEDGETRHFQWLKQLTELLQESEDPSEFMENARLDLFVEEVYVFSRDGDIFPLPRNAMPLDFAYAVHTDVGNHCMGVRINGESVDLQTPLHNGDQVEVLTDSEQTPSQKWLKYVRTPKARQAIRQWFHRAEKEASIRMGEEILHEVAGKDITFKADDLKTLQCADMDVLKEKLGRGKIPIYQVLKSMEHVASARPWRLKDISRALLRPAECCHPLPGDFVLGRFESGQGMIVHHRDCHTVSQMNKETWLDIVWEPEDNKVYPTRITVKTHNRNGMLAAVSNTIAQASGGIEDINIRQLAGSMTTLSILVEVLGRTHLAQVLRALKKLDGVILVNRDMAESEGVVRRASRGVTQVIREMMNKAKSVTIEKDNP